MSGRPCTVNRFFTSVAKFPFAMLVIAFCTMGGPHAGADTGRETSGGAGFLRVLDDIPLMPGLREHVEAGVSFETPSGRIVDAEAYVPIKGPDGKGGAPGVVAFYDQTLLALGWRVEGPGRYNRAGEALRIVVEQEEGGLRVRYSLRPQ